MILLLVVACQDDVETNEDSNQTEENEVVDEDENEADESEEDIEEDIEEEIEDEEFVATPKAPVGKIPTNNNPILAHQFGADPYALEFEGRIYIYNTFDVFELDSNDNVTENTYGSINQISVISSADLVNWTDHGLIDVAGRAGAAVWATQSWAPAAAHKVIDGEDRFFLYFANNASGVGVLTSDSPIGPWEDPIGRALVARSTPGVEEVEWLFDPAVLIDDDGTGYIYFGGGIPNEEFEMPNTARVMQLGDDMTSLVGEPEMIPAPFMFESSGINKWNGTYYYTYSSNFYNGERPEGSPGGGEIAYMTSQQPMGPWEYQGTILRNPYEFFRVGGNNHQVMFDFHDESYIAYHAQTLSSAMGSALGYRSTHINKIEMNDDGTIRDIEGDLAGVEPVKMLNPYEPVQAETMAWNAGIDVQAFNTDDEGAGLAVTEIEAGDWIAVSSVDFESGASDFSAVVASDTQGGNIEVRLDEKDGPLIGTIEVLETGGPEEWQTLTTEITDVNAVHDVYFVFTGMSGEMLFNFDYWFFNN